ncbi:MAG TPA: diguanylate cyclase [Moorella mulderi]|nr:diguanylate cyclase [Moorella mulderi]
MVLRVEDREGKQLFSGSWGWGKTEDYKNNAIKISGQNQRNSFYYPFSGCLKGFIYFETPHRLTEKDRRLLRIFARRIEELVGFRHMEKREEELLKKIFLYSPIGIYVARGEIFYRVNAKFEKLTGYCQEELEGRPLLDLVHPQDQKEVSGLLAQVLQGISGETREYRVISKGGEVRWVEGTLVLLDPGQRMILGNVVDITDKKKAAERLEYLSFRDPLTGLYNRNYFEEQIRSLSRSDKFPITIIIADVDGLKLINDTFGHFRGDELLIRASQILKSGLRSSDMVARIGGDEFIILLPHTDSSQGYKILERLRKSLEQYNQENPHLPLSISFGLATAYNAEALLDYAYKRADDLMYREKLSSAASIRRQILETLLTAMQRHGFLEGKEARVLEHLCRKMGEKLKLSSQRMSALLLLAKLRDIGQVSIPARILLKDTPSSPEEWELIRQHPERGYRLALACPDLTGIADLILKHHERWDGKGYPLGLKGEEIPLECRILSIADAFTAMIFARAYRNAKTIQEALEEIKEQAGVQFDPHLAEVFLEVVDQERGALLEMDQSGQIF